MGWITILTLEMSFPAPKTVYIMCHTYMKFWPENDFFSKWRRSWIFNGVDCERTKCRNLKKIVFLELSFHTDCETINYFHFKWKIKSFIFGLQVPPTDPLMASGATLSKVAPAFLFIQLWSGDPMATFVKRRKESVTNTPPLLLA